MPRAKSFLDIDVVTAARQRVEHIFDTFDTVVVQFSGGKDSLTCLHLVKEFQEKHGLGKVQAVFRDEEIINPSVLDFVNEYRQMDWLDLDWYCNPPEAPIWMADLSFKALGDIRVGDEVMGWVREPDAEGANRRTLCSSRVLSVASRISPLVELTMESGRTVRCTPDHKWLSGKSYKGGDYFREPRVGRALAHVIDPTAPLDVKFERVAGWLAGIYDGEASGRRISQSETHNPDVHAEIQRVLDLLEIPYSKFYSPSNRDHGFSLLGGKQGYVDFVNRVRPIRWASLAARIGRSHFLHSDPIVEMSDVANAAEVISMETSTGNYVAWGYASKNCVPMVKQRVILGKKYRYVEWEEGRPWAHEMPEWAISAKDLDLAPGKVLTEHTMDDMAADKFKGKVAFVTGVRAAESLIRFRAVTQKLNENYISKIEGNPRSRVRLCKPIYDWQQMDVLKWLWENEIQWCPVYDYQELARVGLRVSTPLHAGSARKFDTLREVEPDFYQAIVEIFPDMILQERYAKEWDTKALLRPYLKDGFEGVARYIEENIEGDGSKRTARLRLKEWQERHRKDPENYPVNLLLETIAFGFTKRRLAGVYTNSKAELKKKARKKK